MFSIKDRDIVIPGQLIGEKIRYDENCFNENGRIYSSVRGIARIEDNTVNVIPIVGPYVPRRGDVVIGIVTEIKGNFWIMDIGCAWDGLLNADEVSRERNPDMKKYFDIGDIVSMKVENVDEVKSPLLVRPRKLTGGCVITVNPMKVPRILGKKRSMIDMIKSKTKSHIVVGQNGRVWISGPDTDKVIKIIKKIEKEALTSGLTDRISAMLEQESDLSEKNGKQGDQID